MVGTPHDVDGPLTSGMDWWSRKIRDCLSRHRSRLPVRPFEDCTVDCLCAGNAGEIAGLEALAVPVKVLLFSSKKSASRKWLVRAFCLAKHGYPHMFDDNKVLIDADVRLFCCYGKGRKQSVPLDTMSCIPSPLLACRVHLFEYPLQGRRHRCDS